MAEAVESGTTARARAERLVERMSLEEQIGQLVQVEGDYGHVSDALRDSIAGGRIGSIINEVDPQTVTELQRIARTESRHGIPLLISRDVIHGFNTIFPIPLAMAASWNPALVEQAAGLAAAEAASHGVNWTFSPMLDVSRDPRWGRIAESFGEDPLLTGQMGAAMVRGYQNGTAGSLVSCLKHFVAYGASESGKDYNTTNVPEIELRNVYLPPFLEGIRAGALSVMPSFSDLNGMPPSGNRWLLTDVLRGEWSFEGFVISDWASITQLAVHGVAQDDLDAARQAILAGLNMDMVSGAYSSHLARLVDDAAVDPALIRARATDVLAVKFHAGLFDQAERNYVENARTSRANTDAALDVAKQLAIESTVLLKNENVLPFDSSVGRVCLLGPMADEPYEQLGTWVFDADADRAVSLRDALADRLGERLAFDRVLETTRDVRAERFDDAVRLAADSDVVVVALGEEAILSGEAHCRADVRLPGAQHALVSRLSEVDVPLVVVILAGRPLVIPDVVERAHAVLYAWHPGTMGGPALTQMLFGDAEPTGRLPVSLPRHGGQIPLYYAHGRTGKPATAETIVRIEDIDAKAPQTSVGNTSFHLDVDPTPLFPFGHGIGYTSFEVTNLRPDSNGPAPSIGVQVDVRNVGERAGTGVIQLYVRDLVASATRPVRELKTFERVTLAPGESRTLRLDVPRDALSFFNGRARVFEPGTFRVWVGLDASSELFTDVDVQ